MVATVEALAQADRHKRALGPGGSWHSRDAVEAAGTAQRAGNTVRTPSRNTAQAYVRLDRLEGPETGRAPGQSDGNNDGGGGSAAGPSQRPACTGRGVGPMRNVKPVKFARVHRRASKKTGRGQSIRAL